MIKQIAVILVAALITMLIVHRVSAEFTTQRNEPTTGLYDSNSTPIGFARKSGDRVGTEPPDVAYLCLVN